MNWKFDDKLKKKARNLLLVLNELDRSELRLNLINMPKHLTVFSFYEICRVNVYQKLHYLIAEEFMDNHIRNGIGGLIREIYDGDDESFCKEVESIIYFMTYNFNEIDQGNMTDYSISVWSGFECSINIIYEKYLSSYNSKYNSRNIKKLEKLIKKLIGNESNLKVDINEMIDKNIDYINKEIPYYMTSDDKLNAIYEQIKSYYNRDIKRDKKIIQLFRSVRNSIHNNGIHKGSDISVVIMDEEFNLKKNHICHLNSDSSSIKITIELINIFSEIIQSLSMMLNLKTYVL